MALQEIEDLIDVGGNRNIGGGEITIPKEALAALRAQVKKLKPNRKYRSEPTAISARRTGSSPSASFCAAPLLSRRRCSPTWG